MRRLLVLAVLFALAGLGLAAAPALANGGTYPSNAPTVAPGATVSGGAPTVNGYGPNVAGKTGNEFYRVTLGFGDHLQVDFTNVTGYGTGVCVFDPSVTDYTLTNSSCLEDEHTSSATNKAQLQYIAPTAGSYLLAIHTTDTGKSWAYTAIVNVFHASSVAVNGPSSVAIGKKIKLNGLLAPGGQPVTLQLKSHGWQDVGQTTAAGDGKFKLRYKPSHTGTFKLRVLFNGGAGYLGSISSTVKVHVHR